MARAASAVEEGLAAAHIDGNARNGTKVAEVEEGGHGGAVNVRHAARRRTGHGGSSVRPAGPISKACDDLSRSAFTGSELSFKVSGGG
jgi:hypothetical protein